MIEKRTARQGRLIEEIDTGRVYLQAAGFCPRRFAFSAGETHIGLFSVYSSGRRVLRLKRAWNEARTTWDPFNQLWIPIPAVKQLDLIKPGLPLFLVELAETSDQIVDRVAFTCQNVVFEEDTLSSLPQLKMEVAYLLGVEFIG